ncbi:TetR/AcrR family transcriptional regulator [Umezakia ovalisporum]|uniref:TetR/AcrR family transcriptional regulator n=2 Tax=Umezakia ovalisporum TaxID=75695 RepID=A0AA43GX22_9CYAN|nr:TetR/AcrR family transcriptional regulator [Umezakia ovalisporum]MBI1241233.1 TetR family transcriptional regulator [Nostoc sp. RI_552]MDH6057058.1 TetR/AcrR family transcriptional regulator [Umezakia ovalisporum FSS-43]MDH6063349.1 TetR/AcrR family transcriptional regulator [Umezakia ovalisporum FSS-62]MDH6068718.1 TetR/AcrR family transcriptional regulator [Umezakia ovalisporum APH033B]MDH6070233.1 TetR/AcrR family transcriptional regulator [Umezakia ovalisporum CobakiLakeA]
MGRLTQSKPSSKKPRQVRDAQATKKQILDAAEAEFAKNGLNGARTEAIAKGAGVTTAMIYYYFQNKEGLYKAVLQRPLGEISESVQQLNLDQFPADTALKLLIKEVIDYEAVHRQRGMLWFQEANQNQGEYFKLGNWQENFGYVIKILQRGMMEGCFRQIDPFLVTVQIAGICNFYFHAYENLKHIKPDLQLLTPEMIEQYTQEAINLILGGVEKSRV